VLHRHLMRQLRRLGLDGTTPPTPEGWQELLRQIDGTYGDMDRERYLVQHSMDVVSREMQELNARIEEERDRFASIFRCSPNGMVLARPDGTVVEVNGAFTDMVGLPSEKVVGDCLCDLFEPEDGDSCSSHLALLAAGRTTSGRYQRRLKTTRGEHIVADVHATAVVDSPGHTEFILAVIDDVTERNRLEVELRHSQKLESVGRLAAGIAHEINTPIQFVGDNVNFLAGAFEEMLALCDTYRCLCEKAARSPLSTEDIADQKRREETADLDYIRDNVPTSIASTLDGVGRVARIVQSMKAFAHPDQGERSVADINAALQSTLVVATNELKYVAEVVTELGDIPAVPCFLSDLNQVFLNLLVNAAHAIGDVVGKTGQRGLIKVRTYQEDDQVVIAISDTGTGIPAAVRGKIFDPFFTTKGVGKGTGQGLALARSVVVEQHGGSLTFETEMGKGTTFFVRIPTAVPVAEAHLVPESDLGRSS
jgi:PAS domain S-box-containing protein